MKLFITFVIALLVSCSSSKTPEKIRSLPFSNICFRPEIKTPEVPETPNKKLPIKFNVDSGFSQEIYLVEIDSCEYIYVSFGNASWGSHKGNCKYCAMKAQKTATN